MASHTSGIESTTATKPKRDARGDARSVSDGRGDGRLLHKIFAERPAIAVIASDSSPRSVGVA